MNACNTATAAHSVAIVDIGHARGDNTDIVCATFVTTVRPVLCHRATFIVLARHVAVRHVLGTTAGIGCGP